MGSARRGGMFGRMPDRSAGAGTHESQSIDRDDSERVRVNLEMGAGNLRVRSGAGKLLRADFAYNVPSWKPEVRLHQCRRTRQSLRHTAGIRACTPGEHQIRVGSGPEPRSPYGLTGSFRRGRSPARFSRPVAARCRRRNGRREVGDGPSRRRPSAATTCGFAVELVKPPYFFHPAWAFPRMCRAESARFRPPAFTAKAEDTSMMHFRMPRPPSTWTCRVGSADPV